MAKVSEGSFRRNVNLVDKRTFAKRKKQSYCCSCGEPIAKALGACGVCWAELKTFRRYLRESLRLEPLFGDVPASERGPRLSFVDLSSLLALRRWASL